ncbi:MAG: PA2779 family protein [Arenicellales bacterium]
MSISRRLLVLLTAVSLPFTTVSHAAHASMIPTDKALDTGQRERYISDIKEWLAKDEVRSRLIAMGVDPTDAGNRVSSMTNDELRTLQQKINELPAGSGIVTLFGVVFIVLIILELVGVTHVFSHF